MSIINEKVTLFSIQEWLVNRISSLTGNLSMQIKLDTPLAEYGLDSMHAVALSGDIEDWLGIAMDPTLAWDYPTIETMSQHLIELYSVCMKQKDIQQKVA